MSNECSESFAARSTVRGKYGWRHESTEKETNPWAAAFVGPRNFFAACFVEETELYTKALFNVLWRSFEHRR